MTQRKAGTKLGKGGGFSMDWSMIDLRILFARTAFAAPLHDEVSTALYNTRGREQAARTIGFSQKTHLNFFQAMPPIHYLGLLFAILDHQQKILPQLLEIIFQRRKLLPIGVEGEAYRTRWNQRPLFPTKCSF
jgi:hypothetical protein